LNFCTYRAAALIAISHAAAAAGQIEKRWWILAPEQVVQQIVGQVDGLGVHLTAALAHVVAELSATGILGLPGRHVHAAHAVGAHGSAIVVVTASKVAIAVLVAPECHVAVDLWVIP